MGMYTELLIDVELKTETPDNILKIIEFMIGVNETAPELTSHELFKTERWSNMLMSDSSYFIGDTCSYIDYGDLKEITLHVRCNLKNYDYEIEKFIDFIRPFVNELNDEYWGYKRYEEERLPTLIVNGEYI